MDNKQGFKKLKCQFLNILIQKTLKKLKCQFLNILIQKTLKK